MDAGKREWERQGAGGDPQAAARHLRARLRAGELRPAKLRLAAQLGHEPARIALGDEAPAVELDLVRWLRGLDDHEAAARAALALGWLVVPRWEAAFPSATGPRIALEGAAVYLANWDHVGLGDLLGAAVEATAAQEIVRRVVEILRECQAAGASPLDDPEAAIEWLSGSSDMESALATLGVSAGDLLDVVRRETAGPQGEASAQFVLASALGRVQQAASLAAWACDEAARLGMAKAKASSDTDAFAAEAHRNVGAYARQVARAVGTQTVRDAIRDALVPWALAAR